MVLLGVLLGFAPPAGADPAPCGQPNDIDCDGIPDDQDNCVFVANADQADSDGDRVGNVCDNCLHTGNADQGDLDGDGQGDVCDWDDGSVFLRVPYRTYVYWDPEFGLPTYNLYRGDLGVLKATGQYTQDPAIVPLANRECDIIESPYEGFEDLAVPPVGQALFYLVTYNRYGEESTLGTDSGGHERPNANRCPHPLCDRRFESVLHTGSSDITSPQRLVIGDPVAWCQFRGAPFPCDTLGIDFATEVAVVAAGGSHSNGCFDIRITCARQGAAPDGIEVVATDVAPGGQCGCPDAIVTPMEIVKVPRPVASVSFLSGWFGLHCPL
jgi:hypothetical protein